MPVLRDIGLLATCRAEGGQDEIHAIRDAALAWEGDTLRWVGPSTELPAAWADSESWSAGGRLVIPGLVDCHTHLAFGGWRADEFELRLRGRSYRRIAEEGGGIAATAAATRAASEDELMERAAGFLGEMARLGVTTVEAKSGYGLHLEDELKQLRVYRRLGEGGPQQIVPTFLGAHAVPEEFRGRRTAYVDRVVEEMIPAVAEAGLATACDVFVEDGAFTPEDGRRVLDAGRAHGLSGRVHADQLSDTGGAALAAEAGALSADHLEHVSGEGIAAMAGAGVVAVSLPLAALYLDGPYMPARRCVESGVQVAVATDFNPGSAPSFHLPLAMMLTCTRQRLTPAEVLKGATLYAARACGVEARAGSLEPGKRADFAVIDAPDPTRWMYHFREGSCVGTVAAGTVCWADATLAPFGGTR